MCPDCYQPVPVSAAERVAMEFDKDMCVIICYDRRHQRTHTTTYGKTQHDKGAAANLGKILAAAAGANVERTSMQGDFEAIDKGEYAMRVQFLQAAAAKALAHVTKVKEVSSGEVARELIAALRVSEFADNEALDAAAIALREAATRKEPGP